MNDKGVSILECYDFTVLRSFKGRGALILETDKGWKILREWNGGTGRLLQQEQMMAALREEGMEQLDFFVRNKEGELLTTDKEHVNYLLKEWSDGSESDGKNKEDITNASRNLAKLHKAAIQALKNNRIPEVENSIRPQFVRETTTRELFQKRTREMKKVRNFILHKSQKTDFELYYLKHFDSFFGKASALSHQVPQEESMEITCCHGDYNYHNLLHCGIQVMTLNFEHFLYDTCVRDLSNYCRKVSEKNNWNPEYGHILLDSYNKEKNLTKVEMRNLAYRLSYPEKFYKISNYYLNSKKTWIPVKNKEKLESLVVLEDKKSAFLTELFHI